MVATRKRVDVMAAETLRIKVDDWVESKIEEFDVTSCAGLTAYLFSKKTRQACPS